MNLQVNQKARLTDKSKAIVKEANKMRVKKFISIQDRVGCGIEAKAAAECGDDDCCMCPCCCESSTPTP